MRPQITQMRRRSALIGAVLTLGAGTLAAQTVRGTVVDSVTAQPLASVSVELTDADSQVVARASTDAAGGFVLQAPALGSYRLRVSRIGYRPFESAAVLNSIGETSLGIRLAPAAVELAPVTVEAAQDEFLRNRGYYMRKESERGTFLDPAAVEKLATKAKLATDILVGIPGVRIVGGAPQLRTCRTIGAPGQADSMAPRIYVDGMVFGDSPQGQFSGGTWGGGMMTHVQPNEILAVEVYMGPSQIPLQYGGTNTPCGVIMIWTKH